MKSEFGKGLTYCIGLFLMHARGFEKYKRMENALEKSTFSWPEFWFDGARDHLYELDTSHLQDAKLKQKIEKWATKVKDWGLSFDEKKPTPSDVQWSIKKALEFLRIIDKQLLNTKTVKGEWE